MMKIKNLLLLVVLLIATAAQAQLPDMKDDPAVRIGKLDNGLVYYIRHNNWPENRANFYIAQKVGSIQEEESQRGLAHFLEHMCFNGTKHFPGNEIIRYCESIGVKFGVDLNAYTAIDETVYNINNVPTARQSVLDSCLLILSDWANALTLDPKEIDQERGVIHEEWRMRTSAQSRMFERNLPTLYPNSKYGHRYPIGLMSVVDNFKYKELSDYYHKWYHPTNQGIIVVGNVDVDHTEAMIKKLFGGIKNPANPAPIVKEQVPDNAEPIVIVDKDKEQKNSDVSIAFKHDVYPDSAKRNMMYLVYSYLRNAVVGMLNQRYQEAALNPNCPYVSAGAYDGSFIYAKTKDAFTIDITPKDPSMVETSLKAAFVEARRAAEFGFTATEYQRYQTEWMSYLDKMYSNKDKRTNEQLYRECKDHFLDGEAIVSIDDYYQTMKQIVPHLPIDMVNQMMKEFVPANDSNMVIVNFNNEKEGAVYPTRESLLNAVKEARAEQITAYVDNVKNEPLITKMPKAGKIVKEKKDNLFGYTYLKLSNGAQVIYKNTDYEKDEVLLSATGKGGSSLYGPADYTNASLFDAVIGQSGLSNFSSTELQKALAGKIANANLTMDEKYMGLEGSSTPKDLETLFQLSYLYLTAINKDQQSFDNLMTNLEVSLKNRDLTPETALGDSINATFYDHNPRQKPLTIDRLKEVSYDRILQMAKERTNNAAGWTFTFVGNFDEALLRQYITQYLAALPGKKKVQEGKKVSFLTKKNVDNTFTRKMETPKATSIMVWNNTTMPYTLENEIKASIAGQILSMIYTQKIREEASAAYSVGAMGMASRMDDYHQIILQVYCPLQPEKKDLAISIMKAEVPGLAKSCDPAMLSKVKEYMLKRIDDQSKSNGFWASTIFEHFKYGYDGYTNFKNIVNAQTPESISAFMQEFMKNANRAEVTMLPQE